MANSNGRIYWLASYPKSGNTWLRIVLNLLDQHSERRDHLDELTNNDGLAADRGWFDDYCCIDSADMDHDTVDRLRPRVYEAISRDAKSPLFIKVHDAYQLTLDGEPLFPASATRGVIHIVRNPLDVAVSFAHHLNRGMDETIDVMCSVGTSLAGSRSKSHRHLRQNLLDWSGHTASWLNAPLPSLTIRYEDMVRNPIETFSRVAGFAGLNTDERNVERAVEFSRFDNLSRLESQQRFRECPRGVSRFFRKGQVGDWKTALNAEQVKRLISHHHAMMRKFDYDEGALGSVNDFHAPHAG